MVAFFFVSLCRSFDEKNELESDGDDMKKLNDWNGTLNVNLKFFKSIFSVILNGVFLFFRMKNVVPYK